MGTLFAAVLMHICAYRTDALVRASVPDLHVNLATFFEVAGPLQML